MKPFMRISFFVVAFFLFEGISALGVLGQEVNHDDYHSEKEIPLLELIRNNADGVDFFTLLSFLEMFEGVDLASYKPCGKQKGNLSTRISPRNLADVFFPVTYERFKPFIFIYDKAKRAERIDIVRCLNVFDELSLKAKAFVLASTCLYIERCNALNDGIEDCIEPLSNEEIKLFWTIVNTLKKDESVAFDTLRGSREEWEESFRKDALAFQKTLGKRNLFYAYSEETEEMWNDVCDGAPIVILYSILQMEIRLDPEKLNLIPIENNSCIDKMSILSSENSKLEEFDIMRYYLFLQRAFIQRKAYFNIGSSSAGPIPREKKVILPVKMSEIARDIISRYSFVNEKEN